MLLMGFDLLSTVCCTNPRCDTAETMVNVFPPVSNRSQKLLYSQFYDLIEKESKRDQMVQFVDAKIDPLVLENFNSVNRNESHSILAIDVGGSSLKISTVTISYENSRLPTFKASDSISYLYDNENLEDLKTIKWNDWAALKVKEYAKNTNQTKLLSKEPVRNIGSLTFSFKLNQKSISFATVEACSKNFRFSKEGLLGVNIVDEFNQSLAKNGISLKISCVINDVIATYATAVALGHSNPIGIIIGTGTNAGFVIERNGARVIANSEWAYTDIGDGLIDQFSKDIFSKLDPSSLMFEVIAAGFQFIEVVREVVKRHFNSDYADKVDFMLVRAVYYDNVDRDYVDKFSDLVHDNRDFIVSLRQIIYSFKRRACRIFAPMIVAAAKGKDFTLFTNGSFITDDKDMKLLKQEVLNFIKNHKMNIKVCDFASNAHASLFGAAFVSLVSELIPKSE